MVTDDERREVAERLRMTTSNVRSAYGPSVLRALGLQSIGHESGEFYTPDSVDRLADLIDPDCEEGRYDGVHTARPVDRGALLALAEEMQGYADGAASGDGFPYVNSGSLWSYADRIREALGVAS